MANSALRIAVLVLVYAAGCGDGDAQDDAFRWSLLASDRPGALLSVWGTRHDDVWVVGGDQGNDRGPSVLHFDGEEITSLPTGQTQGNLWWVTGVPDGPVFMGGDAGLVLRYQDGVFEKMPTPSTATVYGLWAASAEDVWAVGGESASGAFAWRLQAGEWRPADGFTDVSLAGANEDARRALLTETASLRKVWGASSEDVWMVGTRGTTVHYDGERFEAIVVPNAEDLFTVHASGGRVATVGGIGSGVIYEWEGGTWHDVTPERAPELTGVWLEGAGGYAVGGSGVVYAREASGWGAVDTGSLVTEDLHSAWVDETGCVFSAGGRWRAYPLTRGLLLHGCDVPFAGRVLD